jgi:hypothetical protein
MARETDQRAGSFETENTGGVLTGFLADEEVFDRSSLLRLGSWGMVAVAAVIIAVYTSQSSIGVRRELVAAADLTRQAQQLQSAARESQNETRRLASAIDTLNGDRDRLYSRVTVLEQGMDSVTGAIARQATAVASPQAAAATAAASVEPPPATPPPANIPAPTPAVAPAVASVATTAAKTADKPPMDKAAPEQAPATVATAAPKASNTPTPTPVPLVAAKSMMAPPDAAAAKLIEPEKSGKTITAAPMPDVVASAPAADNAEPDAPLAMASRPAVQRTEFGIDLGSANSLGGLRALWRGLLKSRSNAALTTLSPIIVIRESNTGLGMQLRLVAGPLDDAAAAAKICAGLIENQRPCETAVYDGQRLAMKAEEPKATDKPPADNSAVDKPAAVKPVWHRRGYQKRAAVEEPTKKPDPPSVLSSFFSRR